MENFSRSETEVFGVPNLCQLRSASGSRIHLRWSRYSRVLTHGHSPSTRVQRATMCLRPSSSSGSNSAVDDNSSNEADSSPPVLTDFSNLVGALHKAVDAIRAQNGLDPVVSEAARLGPRRFDVCTGPAVVCPSCGRSLTAGGEERWNGWLPWQAPCKVCEHAREFTD